MAYKGLFKPRYPQKYKGNPTRIVYRSRWEMIAMGRLDLDSSVLEWSSEELAIPYRSPVDGKIHRYFVDLLVKRRMPNGQVRTALVEIKPAKECVPPVRADGKSERKFLTEAATYAVNQAKWEAARAYAKSRGWVFEVATEKELGLSRS